MALYEGSQSIYTAALGDYLSKGFRLVGHKDGSGTLYFQDAEVATISGKALTIQSVQLVCENWLMKVGV